ncbi:hypothetical protein OG455_38765 [Kitasatospora sp. NBC_01287]|uniref:hypothetical protein n=1 Tax=Kitasatospora sp. NBC_01287 TaxID=2903573 RepID=UPI0022531C47|nr:hypothetical protein [Kitasatospora sp. NBC_01287]MCX4751380.1 hypothetical protein [Kitasatospora sp. NBC_01287]
MAGRGDGAAAGRVVRDRTKGGATPGRPGKGTRGPWQRKPRRQPALAGLGWLLGLLLMAGGAAGCWAVAGGIGYAARVAGTPGLLTVERCEVHTTTSGRTSHYTVCGGTFRSDDGRVTVPASFDHSSRPTGSTIPVQYHDGGLSTVGVLPVAGRLCALALALLAVLGGGLLLVGGTVAALPATATWFERVLWTRRTRRLVQAAALGCGGAAALAGLVSLIALAAGG